jgi:hypothetical protein
LASFRLRGTATTGRLAETSGLRPPVSTKLAEPPGGLPAGERAPDE